RPREDLAVLTPTYLLANGWDPFADGQPVYSLAIEGTTLYVGGVFGSLEFEPRQGLAALDLHTGLVTAWESNGAAEFGGSLAGAGGPVYVGGGFGWGGVWHRNPIGLSTAVTTAVEREPVTAPGELRASPNPFRGQVTLRYTLPRAGPTQLLVF